MITNFINWGKKTKKEVDIKELMNNKSIKLQSTKDKTKYTVVLISHLFLVHCTSMEKKVHIWQTTKLHSINFFTVLLMSNVTISWNSKKAFSKRCFLQIQCYFIGQPITTFSNYANQTYHFYCDFLNLKPKNDGPYQTQDKTWITINDVFCSNILKIHLKKLFKKCFGYSINAW